MRKDQAIAAMVAAARAMEALSSTAYIVEPHLMTNYTSGPRVSLQNA